MDKTNTKGKAAQGASTPTKKTPVKAIRKEFDFEQLNKLVNNRAICERHLTKLKKAAKDEDFLNEIKTPSDSSNLTRIELYYGGEHRAGYQIDNVVLVSEVNEFLIQKIEKRKLDLEIEIQSFK